MSNRSRNGNKRMQKRKIRKEVMGERWATAAIAMVAVFICQLMLAHINESNVAFWLSFIWIVPMLLFCYKAEQRGVTG